MHVVSTAEEGEVNAETLFEFAQDGSVVSARYAGGHVRIGYLVGTVSAEGIRFRYAQVDMDGRLDGGYSICELSRMADGRIRLQEHFKAGPPKEMKPCLTQKRNASAKETLRASAKMLSRTRATASLFTAITLLFDLCSF
jgi:hypothetical protein